MAVATAERLLTGEALALVDVELVMQAGAAGIGVVLLGAEEPFVVAGGVLAGAVPLIVFVASFTSWNFSINCRFNQREPLLITIR